MQIDREIDRQIAFSECVSGTVLGKHWVDTSMHVYMDVCRYIHIYMTLHVYIYIYTHTHTHICIHKPIYMSGIVLGKHSGRAAVRSKLEQMATSSQKSLCVVCFLHNIYSYIHIYYMKISTYGIYIHVVYVYMFLTLCRTLTCVCVCVCVCVVSGHGSYGR
jgi:hypothetical protein